MFYLLSDGRLGQPLGVRAEEQFRAIFEIFAIGFTAISVEIQLLYLRAWRLREPLRLDERERFLTRADLAGWHSGNRRDHRADPGAHPSGEPNRMERMDLFFDGDSGPGARGFSETTVENEASQRGYGGWMNDLRAQCLE